MFHADDEVLGFPGDMAENVGVVHFTGAWFLPSGVIGALEVGDFAPAAVHGVDDVTAGDLLVIHVV